MGIPIYETLHLLYNEIKSNAMVVHSNLGGGQHVYLILVVRPTTYALLANTLFILQLHPGNFIIPIATNLHSQEEIKLQYDVNILVFHEKRGLERVLIQKLVLDAKARYITAMRNINTGQ